MAYGWYHSISVQHNQVPSNQSNFPVLVNFTDANLATVAHGGKVQNSSGFDIGFYSDNQATSILSWEMERYTATTGEVVAWVKLPTISSTAPDTTFYVFYGDPTITTDQSNPTDTWSNNYLSVYHFKDGTTLSVADSLNANNGVNHGGTATTGQVDGGVALASASSQYVDILTWGGLTAATFSAWVNATSFPNAFNSIVVHNSNNSSAYIFLMVKSTGKLNCTVLGNAQIAYDGTGSHTLSTGTWYHVTLTYDSTTGLIGYVNAAQDNSVAANGALATVNAGTLVGNDTFNAGRFWNGSIDEVQISTVARSADWITATYNSHKPGSTFVSHGGQTPAGQIPSLIFAWS